MRTMLRVIVLLLLAVPAFAQADPAGVMFRAFRTLDPGVYEVAAEDVGALMTASGNDVIELPAPELLPVGTIGFRKGDNGAGAVHVWRQDGEPIAGWAKLTLAMHGDYCHVGNTGTAYVLVACGSGIPGGSGGQHRTAMRSDYPWYPIGPETRGGIVRYCNNTGESGNVVLPSGEYIGFAAAGYRNGFTVTILAACLPPGTFIAIHAFGSNIHQKGPYILLTHEYEIVTLDFDSQQWFIKSHYIPGAEPSKP